MTEPGVIAQLEREFELTVSAEQKSRVRIYLEMIQRWNRRINLTAIDRVDELLRLNFFEAFWAARLFLPGIRRLADVGSGAGFPGLAMLIWQPSLDLVLIEPNYKRAVFLKEAARRLDLKATVITAKAEDYDCWGGTDIAAFKALRPSAELLGILKQCGVRLLLFEGPEGVSFPGLRRERRELVPGSAQRFVSLATWEQ